MSARHDVEPCFSRTGGPATDHNTIPVRFLFRLRWVCVRCGRRFKVPTR